MSDTLTLYHWPQSRSAGVRILLEALDTPYTIELLDFTKGAHKSEAFLKINPMGKVPTLVHNGVVITEQVAIYIYLADAFPKNGLAPAIGTPERGTYLRWMAYYGSAFEPAICDKALKLESGSTGMMPYGDFETMQSTLMSKLADTPFMAGQSYSAADILWGTALRWMTQFDLIEINDLLKAYMERSTNHSAFGRAKELDDALLADISNQK
jgi:glutathione S-transferase